MKYLFTETDYFVALKGLTVSIQRKAGSIIGARPNFIKFAPLSRELRKDFDEVIIHTGQHYDYEMNKVFFDELNIPEPDYHLGVVSGLHGEQTGDILKRTEEVLLKEAPVRILLGLPLVLFLPGYSLIATLFPRKDDLDGIERVALSFGLSIATSPLLGFALNYTPFGIRLMSILTVLSIFTIALAFGAWTRRSRIPDEDRFVVDFGAFFRSIKEWKVSKSYHPKKYFTGGDSII